MVRSRFPFLIPFERRNEGEGGEKRRGGRRKRSSFSFPLLFSCFPLYFGGLISYRTLTESTYNSFVLEL